MNNSPRIIFMGTPDFAVASLDTLVKNNYNVVGVITSTDKPAGRGRKLQQSAVKQYAVEHGLRLLQPEKLRNREFLNELSALKADLQIVVAFRMLPEVVWAMPRLGTFNLHASLLPNYRGAAPINWAVMNGEKETGVSTFFIDKKIDTGRVIFREEIAVDENETAGSLHDKLIGLGASLVLKTVENIQKGGIVAIDQEELIKETTEIKEAPKIFPNDCLIDWDQPLNTIYNFIRGLSPYPAARTNLLQKSKDKELGLKLFWANKLYNQHGKTIGTFESDNKSYWKIAVADGWLDIQELQLAGKKRLNIEDFLRGVDINDFELALN